MKFLCDRCKTRYSIGDERVRGKILKIRCKNCANVITVREGMPDADAAPGAGVPRRTKTTTAAPVVAEQAEAPTIPANGENARANSGALGAAFASAMSKPPPALDEEWYVSIDGDQSGPFSLAEAQRWVAGKAFDDDLHCWSEGFDDWLPVDKVSHFRGLRKKPPPPPMPPPVPRGGSGPARAITAQVPRSMAVASLPPKVEEEPKPLFAATMASLEKSAAAAPAMSGGMAMRVEARVPAPIATPIAKPTPYVNGGTARGPGLPAAKPATAKGLGLSPVPAKMPAFDASELGATKVEAPAFSDESQVEAVTTLGTSEPHLRSFDKASTAPNDAFLDSLATRRDDDVKSSLESLASLDAAKAAEADSPSADELDIGEVSRVVKLADIMRQPRTTNSPANAAKRTGPVGRISGSATALGGRTGSVPRINGTAPVALIDAVDAPPSTNPLAVMEPLVPVETTSKRGLIVLLVCAALLVGAAAVVVIKMLATPDDATGLGGTYQYDGERPDDPISRRPGDPGLGSVEPPVNPFIPRPPRPQPRPQTPGSSTKIDPPTGNSLRSDEIEGMAAKSSATTTACFRRADKGADAIRLADVKKIRVTFKVMPDGSIAPGTVDLSEKSSATLTACIQRMIGGWKFRANQGGDFGFVFAKPD